MAGSPTNAEIADKLLRIRTLMEFAGEPFFKFMAYERAASAVQNAATGSGAHCERDLTRAPRHR